MTGGFDVPEGGLPDCDRLKEFLRTHDIGKRLIYTDYKGKIAFADYTVDRMIGGAVEKYLHKYGTEAPIVSRSRRLILRPLMRGVIGKSKQLTLMVPIALTHFDFDRYRLSDSTYLARIPERLQFSRARMSALGSGASEQVVHAATHAFVSNHWTIDADEVGDISKSLSSASDNAVQAIESFLGALRAATGVKTGYAQLLWVPRGWALDYYCDLPPTYGTTVRQYPSEFDRYGWVGGCPTVSVAEMDSVRCIYEQITNNESEAVRLAIKRLSGCLTRSDPLDAVLDGTIGLELLLGDSENQSLSYKLRLRAASLSFLDNSAGPASEIVDKVKRIYKARSAIVHGVTSKQKKKVVNHSASVGEDDRQLAAELLRFVLRALLANPDYLDPMKIDGRLILRGELETPRTPES
ncbi:HEPN domain-containing protein [Sulfitobacter sp. F26204]|uniref:HEPN domain-containing protein n=1 Tax=Sulfitobacter sp. F26204 TaxID=2996014 RepID=UPI00225DE0C6|nr:HEPN domain-containing protein [Sulfitobacter sp. F26204]MCX7560930.1 HEPN domain-containing protein [Sulfitobacter sp. F26204]